MKTAHRKQPKAAEQAAAPGRDEILLLCLYGWKVDKDLEARAILHRYCRYICNHGYQVFPSTAIELLETMSRRNAEIWICETYAQCVQDGSSMLRYIFGL